MNEKVITALPRPSRAYAPAPTPAWVERVDSWESVADSPAFVGFAKRILELAAPQPHDVAVDLGCGTGLLALPLAELTSRVSAVDYSKTMLARLADRAQAGRLENLDPVHADLRELPLEDESATVVVSNYAFHHLADEGKELALSEARRVLRPGGRLVVCDMMFALSLAPRDRAIITSKVVAIARKGPGGILRLARNAGRVAAGRWEHPSPPQRWREMLEGRSFTAVTVEPIEHEAGIACARRPLRRAS
ncbi:class I SAM-dependent methyltransferase [Gaiella occulta]|uniref:class I SAM-dependent methyltransferase n=1 Tax=Gaiella occulta TaxID=1002870 RepID=UPI0015F105CC|nr:class I SAM-dependent methyltransferase [Gaiella occulta]